MEQKFYKKGALARAMGHAPNYVSAMIRAGYVMEWGDKSSLMHGMRWKKAHPEFRVSDWYPSMKGPLHKNPNRKSSTADKSDAPAHSHAQ